MPISYDARQRLFRLDAGNFTHAFCVHSSGALISLYSGPRLEEATGLEEYPARAISFSPFDPAFPGFSLDDLPQEFSTHGGGDFGLSSAVVRNPAGDTVTMPVYRSHRIYPGKALPAGLPGCTGSAEEAETLEILLEDPLTKVEFTVVWSIFHRFGALVRSLRVRNGGTQPVTLEKAASLSLDLWPGIQEREVISFSGSHCRERCFAREPLSQGIRVFGSDRGLSSHQCNPFLMVCSPEATETSGEVWGAMLVYSGSWRGELEVDQLSRLRLNLGLSPQDFRWRLGPGEEFQSPEAILAYSPQGFDAMSQTFHDLLRETLMASPWTKRPRPILINNWECMQFDFNQDKLLKLARTAAAHGIEMMVLDDGWFGQRDSDHCSLGDWQENTRKLSGTLAQLSRKIHALGMKFGLWFEPEMVSPDSDLCRSHPQWVLGVPGRARSESRWQCVLDFSRQEVVDNIYGQMEKVLSQAQIEYVKWDANRHLTEAFSQALPPERRGETLHRYVLGLYQLQKRLTERFPEILFEGCSGGGGRFDAGILHYFPQIWCSDNTDVYDRLKIQYGTSFAYPPSAMGAHVASCWDKTRYTDFETRGNVALAGTFGYELDLDECLPEEREQVPEQCRRYHQFHHLVEEGGYHRLTSPWESPIVAWMNVARDQSEFLLTVVQTDRRYNAKAPWLRLRGLDPWAVYQDDQGHRLGGDLLMQRGLPLLLERDSQSLLLHFRIVKEETSPAKA